MSELLFSKVVDLSFIRYGMTLTNDVVARLRQCLGDIPAGGSKPITIVFEGEPFQQKITSVDFDREKYSSHSDIWRVMFSENTPLGQKFNEVFVTTAAFINGRQEFLADEDRRERIQIPEKYRETIDFYLTDQPDIWLAVPHVKSYQVTTRNRPQAKANNALQLIIYGAPGTGKSHMTDSVIQTDPDVIRTTFHPDSDYASFVGSYKPTMSGNDGKEIVYSFVAQAFLKAYVQAWRKQREGKVQYLVIEEINRGNCAQIFGDLFQLLDRDDEGFSKYPITPDEDMRHYLCEQAFAGVELGAQFADIKNGTKLMLPRNMYIWATMNTSDQSLYPVDSAFKRRWEWKYMPIRDAGKKWVISIGTTRYDWWSFISKINEEIGAATSSEDKKIGYFFAKADPSGVISSELFVGKVLFYLWNDVFKDYGFVAECFKYTDAEGSERERKFQDFFQVNGDPDELVVAEFLESLDVAKALE